MINYFIYFKIISKYNKPIILLLNQYYYDIEVDQDLIAD